MAQQNSKPSNKKVKAHPFQDFVNLSLDELLNEPVSLRELDAQDREAIEKEQAKQDYSFIMKMEFEDLFSLPVSIARMQEDMEKTSSGVKSEAVAIENNGSNIVKQSFGNVTPISEITSTPRQIDNPKTPPPTQQPPQLPPIIDIPIEIFPPQPVGHDILLNETLLNINEVELAQGNIFELEGINPEGAEVISIFGVTHGSEGDIGESNNQIYVRTNYGFAEIHRFTGNFAYELYDVSDVDDALQFAYETIGIEIDANGTIVNTQLNVTIDLNQAPIANDNFYSTFADQPLVINSYAEGFLANDTDPDNTETVTDLQFLVRVNDNPQLINQYFELNDGGMLRVQWDGTFEFDPIEYFDDIPLGESQEVNFTYTIMDAGGLESTATVTIQVQGVNPIISIHPDDVPEAPRAAVDYDRFNEEEVIPIDEVLSGEEAFCGDHCLKPLFQPPQHDLPELAHIDYFS